MIAWMTAPAWLNVAVAAAATEAGSAAAILNILECDGSKPAGMVHVEEDENSEPAGVEDRSRAASMNEYMAIGRR